MVKHPPLQTSPHSVLGHIKIETMTVDQKKIWDAGCNLWQSMFRYGPPDIVRAYAAIPANQPFLETLNAWTALLSKEPSAQAKFSESQTLINTAADLRKRLEKHIRQELQEGRLAAIGFSVPRRPDDSPAIVPQDVMSGTFQFERNTIKGNGLEFVAVRIVQNSAAEPVKALHKRRPDRPSVQEPIKAVFKALQEDGKIDRNKAINSNFPAIRAKLAEMYPDSTPTKISDKLLYRVIPPLLKSSIVLKK